MLVGLSDNVSLETGVPNDILEGEGFPTIWASADICGGSAVRV